MKVLVDSRRLILFFILLTPVVGNLNGLIFWKFGVFSVGPLVYGAMLAVLCLALLSLRFDRRVILNNYLIFAGIGAWFAFHSAMYGGAVESFRFYIKFFMPILVYRFLVLYFGDDRKVILDFLGKTVLVWSGMAMLTATLRIRPSAGEGYYGFIHGNNDYVVMLFALYPFSHLWNSYWTKGLYLVALVLTRSKGMLLLGMVIFMQQKSKVVRIVALAALAGIGMYYYAYFRQHYLDGGMLTGYRIAHFLTFGRVGTLLTLVENVGLKGAAEHFLGSGIKGSFVITEGKGNVEMDVPDVYNIFGLAGMALVAWFYYYRVWSHPFMSRKMKYNFIPLFLLSALGGHFFFNTVSNVVFALLMFVSGDPEIIKEKPKADRSVRRAGKPVPAPAASPAPG